MTFVTKDSGERQTFSTGMQRDSAEKELRPDLIYGPMLLRWRGEEGVSTSVDSNECRLEVMTIFLDWFYGRNDSGRDDLAGAVFECIAEAERFDGRGLMLVRWAELMGRGAIKYGERNWEKARTQEELDRFRASAFRHFLQWLFRLNPEEDHAAAVFFNVAGAEYVKERIASEAPVLDTIKCLPDSTRPDCGAV